MGRTRSKVQDIESKRRALKNIFKSTGHGNMRSFALNAAKFGIQRVRDDRGEHLDAAYCASLKLPPPSESHTYSEIMALHLSLVTLQLPPDPDIYDNNLIYSALGLEKLDQVKKALIDKDTLSAEISLKDAEILHDLLDSEIRANTPGVHKKAIQNGDMHRSMVSKARSEAVKLSAPNKHNAELRVPVTSYVNKVASVMRDARLDVSGKSLARAAMKGFDNNSSLTNSDDPVTTQLAELAGKMADSYNGDVNREYVRRNVLKAISENKT